MGQFFTEIPDSHIPWIQQQKMFWVATAPLSGSGHVNVSPKGYEGTFHIVDSKTVWYEDLTGSGSETIAHVRENGRMTIMFCAFEGPPRILRLFGTGSFHEFGTPEYNALVPLDKRTPGSRSVIMLDIHKVGTSCGYSVPFYTFKAPRVLLKQVAAGFERKDVEKANATCIPESNTSYASATSESTGGGPTQEEAEQMAGGLKAYWKSTNQASIDGLPSILEAFNSPMVFDPALLSKDWGRDDESISTKTKTQSKADARALISAWLDVKLVVGFMMGMVISGLWSNFDTIFQTTSFKL